MSASQILFFKKIQKFEQIVFGTQHKLSLYWTHTLNFQKKTKISTIYMGKRCQNFELFNQSNKEADDGDDVVEISKSASLFGHFKSGSSFWRFQLNGHLKCPNQDDAKRYAYKNR